MPVSSTDSCTSVIIDHRIRGRTLFPGTGFFELADTVSNMGRQGLSVPSTESKCQLARLYQLVIQSPLIIGSMSSMEVSIMVNEVTGVVEIASSVELAHLRAKITNVFLSYDVTNYTADAPTLKSFLLFEKTSTKSHHATAQVKNGIINDANSMWMHPAALDASLQLGFCASSKDDKTMRLPVGAHAYDAPVCSLSPSIDLKTNIMCLASKPESSHVIGAARQQYPRHACVFGLVSKELSSRTLAFQSTTVGMSQNHIVDSSNVNYILSWLSRPEVIRNSRKDIILWQNLEKTRHAQDISRHAKLRRMWHSKMSSTISDYLATTMSACQIIANIKSTSESRIDTIGSNKTTKECSSFSILDRMVRVTNESIRAAFRVYASEARHSTVVSAFDHSPLFAREPKTEKSVHHSINFEKGNRAAGYGVSIYSYTPFTASLTSYHVERRASDFETANLDVSQLARSAMFSHNHRKNFDGNSAAIGGGSGGIGSVIVPWLMQEKKHTSSTVFCRSGRSSYLQSCSAVDIVSIVNVTRSDISVSEEAMYGGCKVAQDRENPQLVTTVHACGVLSDAIIRNQTVGTLRKTTAPKFSSILHSSPACVNAISHCLTFSSIATLLGSPGQSNYAAANGALDAWSTALRDEGSPIVSLQWGAWYGAGMGGMAASNPGKVLSKLTQLGFGLLTPKVGIRALRDIMDEITTCGPVIMVSPFDPSRLLKASSLDSPISPILESLLSITNSRDDIHKEQPDLSCLGRVNTKTPEVREIALKAASEILMKRPQSGESLVYAGLDSLSAI